MKSTTHQASAWGLVWKDPKGFLISAKFSGFYGHLKFVHFLLGFTCRRLGLLYLWQYFIQYIALQSS